MNRKAALILSTALAGAVIIAGLVFLAGGAGAGPASLSGRAAGAPAVVSYQGQVTVDSEPFSGAGYFKFAIVDPEETVSYWSNDGSSDGGSEPDTGVPLVVVDGLFSALLGDTDLEGMTQPLEQAVFADPDTALRVWFSSDGVDYTQLTPDRRIAAVPYALQAEVAADADTLDGLHAADLGVPSGALLLGASPDESALTTAGLSYTGRWLESWTTRADMPTGRYSLGAVAADGLIYAVGGITNRTENESYDPATDRWSSLAPLTVGRHGLALAEVDGVIYAIGGSSALTLCATTVEAYYPLSDTWEMRAPMPTGRAYLAAAVVDGIIYAIGGMSCSTDYEITVEAYDPGSDTWDNVMPMDVGRYYHGAAAVGGYIYTFGGKSAAGDEDRAEVYDPVYNHWTAVAPLPRKSWTVSAAAIGDLIYVTGVSGAYNGVYDTFNFAYDPAGDAYQARATMPSGRYLPASTAVDGMLYILGGIDASGGPTWRSEAYVPPLYVYEQDQAEGAR